MNTKPVYNVEVYVDENGSCPYGDWLSKLDGSIRFRIQARIERVKYAGNFGQIRVLSKGVSEMKCSFGGGIRIYYVLIRDKVILLILLLFGGNKSTQLKGDINMAIDYLKKYQENHNG